MGVLNSFVGRSKITLIPQSIKFRLNILDGKKNSEKIQISTNIINLAEHIKADIIICNFAQAVYNNQTIIESPVPIMFVEHCIYPIPNVIYRWNQAISKLHKFHHKSTTDVSLMTGFFVNFLDSLMI